MDTPISYVYSWDAPNNIYDGNNTTNDTTMFLNISSLVTADTGEYVCSARAEDSSGNQYIISSEGNSSESYIISELYNYSD